MELNSDQKIQKIFNQIQYSNPNLQCRSKNKVTLLCLNRQCSACSLHCQDEQCNFCIPHQERSCISFQLRYLTVLMKKRSQSLKYFMQQMIKIETNMFKVIQKKRIQLLQNNKYGNLSQQEVHIIENLFKKQNSQSRFKSFQIADLVKKLKKNNQMFRIEDQLAILKKKTRQLTDQICKAEQDALDEIINPTKNYVKVDSKVMEDDAQGLRFILQELNHPPQLKLLYRASSNGFSSIEFHKICDNVPNTLTIIKTEHNKVIAGYTPLAWEFTDTFKTDSNLETFVLSVTHRQKYKLIKPQKAIGCSKKYGPIFGNKDFIIENRQPKDKGTQIRMNFPQNFNYEQKYKEGPQTILRILGKDNNKYVSVDEYEVYIVIQE